MPVKVPAEVLDTLEAVRRLGKTNMLDRNAVQYLANDLGGYKAVVWIEDHKRDYARGIFEGFEAEEVE